MSNTGKGSRVDPRLISAILSDARQRRILSLIAADPDPLTERDLAVQLAAREERKPPARVTEAERKSRCLLLHHQKLPKLESAGLIVRTSAGVRLVPSFPVDLAEFGVPLPSAERTEDRRWDVVAAFVARPYRQHVTTLVADASDPLTLEQLTAHLVDHDEMDLGGDEAASGSLQLRLHHVDLPKLDDLDVLSYDPDARLVRPGRSLTAVQ